MADDENDGTGNDSGNPFASGIRTLDPTDLGPGDPDGSGASPTGTDSSPDQPRKRGRKPGSKNGTKKEKIDSASVTGIEKILFSVHLALAAATRTPELALDESEARELAKAAAEVQSHYETVIDPKILAWAQLVMVAGSIYAPRMIAAKMRLNRERAEQRAKSNVVQGPFGNSNHAPTG